MILLYAVLAVVALVAHLRLEGQGHGFTWAGLLLTIGWTSGAIGVLRELTARDLPVWVIPLGGVLIGTFGFAYLWGITRPRRQD